MAVNEKVPLHSSFTQGIVISCDTDILCIPICLTLSKECSIKMFNASLYLSIHQCIYKRITKASGSELGHLRQQI